MEETEDMFDEDAMDGDDFLEAMERVIVYHQVLSHVL